MIKDKKGFTLIELLVVVAIIGLLSTLSILALNTARARARDARRVADVKQIQTALEMYYNDVGIYPTTASVTSGARIFSPNGTFMAAVPTPPTPANDGSCTTPAPHYTYSQTLSGASYTITYCLGAATGGITSGGVKTATPAGLQ